MGVFVSDQYKPSMRYKGSEWANDGPSNLAPGADQPMALPCHDVMELEEDPAIETDPLDDWRTLYLDYLLHDTLPTVKMEARWLAGRTKSFVLVEGELYKWSHAGILHFYIPVEQGKLLLSDIHGGVYSYHTMPRTLVGNTF